MYRIALSRRAVVFLGSAAVVAGVASAASAVAAGSDTQHGDQPRAWCTLHPIWVESGRDHPEPIPDRIATPKIVHPC